MKKSSECMMFGLLFLILSQGETVRWLKIFQVIVGCVEIAAAWWTMRWESGAP